MAALASVTISLGVPLLAIILERHGYDAFTIGLNTATGAIGSLAVAPFTDRLARRYGAVRIMQAGLLAAGASILMFPLLVDLWLWTLWRLVLGGAGAILFVLSEAAINAMAPPARRGQLIALYATAFSLGFASGPLLLSITGSEGFLPFLVAAGALALAAIPLCFVNGIDRLLAGDQTVPVGFGGADLLRRGAFPYAGILVYAVLETSFFALLPIYVLAQGLDEGRAAAMLSVWIAGNVVWQLPIGWLVDRWASRPVLALCAVLAAAGLLVMGTAPTASPWIWPLLICMGGAMGALYTISLTMIGERFRAGELTRANSLLVVIFQVGLLVGPVSVGAGMTMLGAASFPLLLMLPIATLLVAALGYARRRSTI